MKETRPLTILCGQKNLHKYSFMLGTYWRISDADEAPRVGKGQNEFGQIQVDMELSTYPLTNFFYPKQCHFCFLT